MSGTTTTCLVSLLIPHPSRTAVLVSDPGTVDSPKSDVSLPVVQVHSEEPSLPEILAAAGEVIAGLPPVLRTVATGRGSSGDAGGGDSFLVEFEPYAADPPGDGKWQGLAFSVLDQLEPESSRAAVADWVREREEGWSSARPAWSRPGWFARASAWVAERAAADGNPLVGEPQQHQLWDISVVLRAASTRGDVFFKCSPDIFRHEAAATRALAEATPTLMPSVIAVDEDEGWMLMRDFGGTELGELDASLWQDGLIAHATIQQAWVHRVDELISLGVPVRSLAELAEQVSSLSDDSWLMDRLPVDVRERWLSSASALADCCRRLDEMGPGPTLVHGDFHPWNVVSGPGGTRVFDWTDAAVSHPYVDLATYVGRSEDPAVRRRLMEAYVGAWAPGSSGGAIAVAALGMVVGALYQVMTYRTLLPTMPNNGADAGLGGVDLSCVKRSLDWHDAYAAGSYDVVAAT